MRDMRPLAAKMQNLPAKIVNDTSPASRTRDTRRRGARRRSSKMLEHSPTTAEAAKILRRAGRPLHVTAITKKMNRSGRMVALGTVVSTPSRRVNSRSVFYRVRPNVFGLIAQRHRSGGR